MIRRKVSKAELVEKKYLTWNAFIDLVAMECEEDLTEIQKNGKRVFVYDSEIQNGGHLQYFENTRLIDYGPIVKSLKEMEGFAQAELLQRAVHIFQKHERPLIKNANQYSETALEGEFDSFDTQYYRANPSLTELMKRYLNKYIEEFIEFTE